MTSKALEEKYVKLKRLLDERSLRICLAADAKSLGRGGTSRVAKAAKVSRTTVHAGLHELEGMRLAEEPEVKVPEKMRIRKPGAGRKLKKETDAGLLRDLDRLLDPVTRGDPMSTLRWTCKSTPRLAKELQGMGHEVSQSTVWRLLDDLGYSMQSNRKTDEGAKSPDRNAQFEYIGAKVDEFLSKGLPVISVDAKKKELVGEYKNGGREWQRKGSPEKVKVYDFIDGKQGKAIPYGVYDIGRNDGWVSVGITHDTAEFAAASIRHWWQGMGKAAYPDAKELLITADGGGSNGSRTRLWKVELQRLAADLGLAIHVRHFPPGTSKWNKIEHRMFCHITENWRGRPLVDLMTIVNLISNTRTSKGLVIRAGLDRRDYENGRKVSKDELDALVIERCDFHGEWNYCIMPEKRP